MSPPPSSTAGRERARPRRPRPPVRPGRRASVDARVDRTRRRRPRTRRSRARTVDGELSRRPRGRQPRRSSTSSCQPASRGGAPGSSSATTAAVGGRPRGAACARFRSVRSRLAIASTARVTDRQDGEHAATAASRPSGPRSLAPSSAIASSERRRRPSPRASGTREGEVPAAPFGVPAVGVLVSGDRRPRRRATTPRATAGRAGRRTAGRAAPADQRRRRRAPDPGPGPDSSTIRAASRSAATHDGAPEQIQGRRRSATAATSTHGPDHDQEQRRGRREARRASEPR